MMFLLHILPLAGTLNEASFAWSNRSLIIAVEETGGTAKQIISTRMNDVRRRLKGRSADILPIESDVVHAAKSAQDVIDLLASYLHHHRLSKLLIAHQSQLGARGDEKMK